MNPANKPESADQTESVRNFIQQQLQFGLQPDEIAAQLRQAGWADDNIRRAFSLVQAQIMPTPASIAPPVAAIGSQAAVNPATPYEQPVQPQTLTQQRGRIKTGWLLFKQSLRVLKNNKVLTRYMFVSAALSLVLIVIFALIFIAGRHILLTPATLDKNSNETSLTPGGYVVALIYYILAYFVVNLYSAGLAANVLDLFHGNSKPYSEYMKKARSRGLTIFIYSVIEATVGLILQAIIERSKLLGRIVARLLGALWSIARLFVIPIIVSSDENAFGAIKQSTLLLKATWGENIVGRVSFGLSMFLIYLLIIFPVSIALLVLGAILGGVIGSVVAVILIIIIFVVLNIVTSAASSVLNIALFYFAQNKQIPAAFDADLLNSVFIHRKKRRGLFGR